MISLLLERLRAFARRHCVVSQFLYSRNAFGELVVVELDRLQWSCGVVDFPV
jgi:hypothetical protein